MIEYRMNVEHYIDGLMAGRIEVSAIKESNSAEHLQEALTTAIEVLMKRRRAYEPSMCEVLTVRQNRQLFKHVMRNGESVDIWVRVVPYPEVVIEVPKLFKEEF